MSHCCVLSSGDGCRGGSADSTVSQPYTLHWSLVRTRWGFFLLFWLQFVIRMEQMKGTARIKEPWCAQHTRFFVSLLQPIQSVLFLANQRLHEVGLRLQARPKSQGHRQGQIHQPTGKFSYIIENEIFSDSFGIFAQQTPTFVTQKEQKFIVLSFLYNWALLCFVLLLFLCKFEVTFLINV